jgi:hypothetical protein
MTALEQLGSLPGKRLARGGYGYLLQCSCQTGIGFVNWLGILVRLPRAEVRTTRTLYWVFSDFWGFTLELKYALYSCILTVILL